MRVLALADTHYPENDLAALDAAVLQHTPDVIVILGDMLDEFHHARLCEYTAALGRYNCSKSCVLGNHDFWSHGKFVYNDQIHVPLIFYAHGNLIPAQTIDNVVSHVDILPTLLDLTAVSFPSTPYPLAGKSFAPFLNNVDGDFDRLYAFSERRPKTKNLRAYEDGDIFCIQDQRHKYIYHSQGTSEFFDLLTDPRELNNLIDTSSPAPDRFSDTLKKDHLPFYHHPFVVAKSDDEPHPDLIRELKALGYVE